MSSDIDDLEPITPNMLMGAQISYASPTVLEDSLAHQEANRRLNYIRQLRLNLEQRWETEYLLSLREFHQLKKHTLSVGDIVLIVDDKRKRLQWRMAIVELFSGRDKRQIIANIRTAKGEVLRPIQRLVPLEVASDNVKALQVDGKSDQPQAKGETQRTRTRVIHKPKRYGIG